MTEVAERDQVAEAVSELTGAVERLREGQLSREDVERIAAEALADANPKPSGYQPPDVDPEVERRGLSSNPVQRLRQLHDAPRREAVHLSGRSEEDIAGFHEAGDRLVLLSALLERNPRETQYFEDVYRPAVRAIDTETSGEGADWVPTNLSSALIERVSLELKVLNLFSSIPMPSNPFEIPGRAMSRTRAGRSTEQTADTGQAGFKKITPASRKVQLSAGKFDGETLVSKEEQEDAIIAVMPLIEEELRDYLEADLEDTAQNGDTAGSHRDTDVTASDDPRKNWDGLRKAANAASAERDAGADKLTAADLRANRALMGKYGVDPSKLAHIVGIADYIDLLSDANVVTVDKYGAQATILTGELGKVDGVPIVVSEYVRANLNATGVYQAANAKTIALTVFRSGFVRGTRRELTVQVLRELYAEFDQDALIVTTRQAFANRFPGQKVVAATYNIAPGV